MNATSWWTELLTLLEGGTMTSSPNYYIAGGGATEVDYRNIAKVMLERTAKGSAERTQAVQLLQQIGFWQPTDDLNYWINEADASAGNINDLTNAAAQRLPTAFGPDGSPTQAPSQSILDTSPPAQPDLATGTQPGVLTGGHLVRIDRAGEEDYYMQVYEYPPGSGQYMAWQYDNLAQVQQTIGPNPPFSVQSDAFLQKVNVVGAASEIAGQTGTFINMVNTALEEGLRDSGISDPTIIGQMLNNPEMQVIFANAFMGEWTPEQIRAEQRKTSYWTDVLYPGIDNFYGQTQNPEQAWAEYAQSVEGALTSLGYVRDADGTFKSKVGTMLDLKIADQTFLGMTPTFLRAKQSPEYFASLSKWTQATLGKPLEFDDWFDLLAGEAEPDIMQVAERATLQFLADTAGTRLTDEGIMRLSAQTDMSEAQARAAFAEYDAALTALGSRGISKYSLSRDDLFALKTGIAPLSQRSLEEIRTKSLQAMREEGLLDDEKIDLFIGYSQTRGNPNRPGLNMLAPDRG